MDNRINVFVERKKKLSLLSALRKPGRKTEKPAPASGVECPGCKKTSDRAMLEERFYVCPCGYHLKISVRRRFSMFFDEGAAAELFDDILPANPIEFPGYDKKLAELEASTGLRDACVAMEGEIGGHRAVCAALDSSFLMGSMGTAVGEKITLSAEYAAEHNLPLIIFSASGGARMQEGIYSLMQMTKTAAAIGRHSDRGLLFISYLTHPTTGGVTASFASLGDIILAEPGALIGFTGPRVIEQTIRQELPEGFQKAEFQLEHGFIDAIVSRDNMRGTLVKLLGLHRRV